MKHKQAGRRSSSEQTIRDIKRKTRKQYGAEEKIRIVLDGLRGEDSIAASTIFKLRSAVDDISRIVDVTVNLGSECAPKTH
jgi:transposase-like protein